MKNRDAIFQKLEAIERTAIVIGERVGLRVELGNHWSFANGVLTIDGTSLLTVPPDILLGYILHEAGHARYTPEDISLSDITRKLDQATTERFNEHGRQITALFNAVENDRMERLLWEVYPQANHILSETRAYSNEVTGLKGLLAKAETENNQSLPILAAIEAIRYPELAPKLPDFAKEFISKHAPELQAYREAKTKEELIPAFQNIAKPFLEFCHTEDYFSAWETERPITKHGPTNEKTDEEADADVAGILEDYRLYQLRVKNQARDLANVLKLAESRKRAPIVEYRQRTGKLDKKRLYQFPMGQTKLFTKRRDPVKPIPPRVITMLDVSGSMYNADESPFGMQIFSAIEGNTFVLEAARLANIEAATIAYAGSAKVIKPFNKQLSRYSRNVFRTLSQGNNWEHVAAKTVSQFIQETKTEKPLVILITDGGTEKGVADEARQIIERAGGSLFVVGYKLDNEYYFREAWEDKGIVTKTQTELIGALRRAILALKKS